jgi:type II secretory pathway pseudopilin PulG
MFPTRNSNSRSRGHAVSQSRGAVVDSSPRDRVTARLRNREQGFTLAALIIILTIISIVIAATVPEQWSMIMRRERDRQTVFQMRQFARAILAWQEGHGGALPTSLDQLKDARKPRVLRGNGIPPCPLTGDEKDWIPVPPAAIEGASPGAIPPQAGNRAPGNNAPAAPRGPSRLKPGGSPKDYLGPFVGVRPNFTGKSFLSLNGAENYDEWIFTFEDMKAEIQARRAQLMVK